MKQEIHPNDMRLDPLPLGYYAKEINLCVGHPDVCSEPAPHPTSPIDEDGWSGMHCPEKMADHVEDV